MDGLELRVHMLGQERSMQIAETSRPDLVEGGEYARRLPKRDDVAGLRRQERNAVIDASLAERIMGE
jgi:hypothetical protein